MQDNYCCYGNTTHCGAVVKKVFIASLHEPASKTFMQFSFFYILCSVIIHIMHKYVCRSTYFYNLFLNCDKIRGVTATTEISVCSSFSCVFGTSLIGGMLFIYLVRFFLIYSAVNFKTDYKYCQKNSIFTHSHIFCLHTIGLL